MDPAKLLQYAEKALGNKAWTVELVLRIGVDLATAVNSFPNLTGEDKCRLVCATIQTMIDNSEKAGIEHMEESTEKENTKARLQECRNAVKMVLPVSLNLVVMASRGKFPFQKALEDISSQPWSLSSFRSWLSSLSFSSLFSSFSLCVPCAQAIDTVVKHPQEYLEEMRGLVLRMEKLLEETKASSVTEVFAPALPKHEQEQAEKQEQEEQAEKQEQPKEQGQTKQHSPQPLPTPESLDVKLPGGLENP